MGPWLGRMVRYKEPWVTLSLGLERINRNAIRGTMGRVLEPMTVGL